MFGPISTLPQILPQLFGLTGQSIPKAFAEFIQPVQEIMELLSATACRELLGDNLGIAAPGSFRFSQLTVPATEAWLVRGASIQGTTAAGEVIRFKLVSGTTTSGGDYITRSYDEGASDLAGAVGVAVATAALPHWIILGPGEYLGVAVSEITTAGTINVQSRGNIFRFSV